MLFRELHKVVEETGITNIFVATDHNPMLSEIREALYEYNVSSLCYGLANASAHANTSAHARDIFQVSLSS